MEKEKFNQFKYMNDWSKANMSAINVKYKKEFVTEFKDACKSLNVKQSDIFRQAMIETIEKAKSKS